MTAYYVVDTGQDKPKENKIYCRRCNKELNASTGYALVIDKYFCHECVKDVNRSRFFDMLTRSELMKNNNIEVKINVGELEHLMALSTGLAVRLRANDVLTYQFTDEINIRDKLNSFNNLILEYIKGNLTYSYIYAEWIELDFKLQHNNDGVKINKAKCYFMIKGIDNTESRILGFATPEDKEALKFKTMEEAIKHINLCKSLDKLTLNSDIKYKIIMVTEEELEEIY